MADIAELELGNANFRVLEHTGLGGNYGFHRPIVEPDLMIPDAKALS